MPKKETSWEDAIIKTLQPIGIALAMILSWSINHSIGWAVLHGVFSWFYVIYWAIQY